MNPILEIATFSLDAALIAGRAGADRIELCLDYTAGGLTPPPEMTTEVVIRVRCPVFVMIRPRPGDFIYSVSEFEKMKADLVRAREGGASGFVFGILKQDSRIDKTANNELIALAAPLPCTFHRAFDELPDQKTGLEILIDCGFRRVLTSGGPKGASNNIDNLKALVVQAKDRIIVMPGGGIRSTNLAELAAQIGATEYHSAAITGHNGLPDEKAISDMKQILKKSH